MRVIKHFFLIVALFCLSACVSDSETIKYYSLNLNENWQSNIHNTLKPARVAVGPVKLAEFLNQDNMVMQTGDYEIYKANYHRWAEPLDQSITKLLVQQLSNKNNTRFQFVKTHGNASLKPDLKVSFEIDKFHATDKAQVFLSGNYWIVNGDKSFEILQRFNYSDQLTKDGYQHSVEKLIGLISQLADQIMLSLENSE